MAASPCTTAVELASNLAMRGPFDREGALMGISFRHPRAINIGIKSTQRDLDILTPLASARDTVQFRSQLCASTAWQGSTARVVSSAQPAAFARLQASGSSAN